MGYRHLTRISHQHPAATASSPASTSLRSVGLLNVVSNYACAGLGRAPRIHRPRGRFASNPGAISGLKRAGQGAPITGRCDQMDVVRHQVPGKDGHPMVSRELAQQVPVKTAIFVVPGYLLAVVATLGHVMWKFGNHNSWRSRHLLKWRLPALRIRTRVREMRSLTPILISLSVIMEQRRNLSDEHNQLRGTKLCYARH